MEPKENGEAGIAVIAWDSTGCILTGIGRIINAESAVLVGSRGSEARSSFGKRQRFINNIMFPLHCYCVLKGLIQNQFIG
ncbi:hypothetical protein CRYUN_Cryun29cG0010900 [Craigia yunnanensis]